jgi:hypothetical protein
VKDLLRSLFLAVKKHSIVFALLVVPLLLAILAFLFLRAAFPLHSGSAGYDQDPAYAYLFNGLLILDGQPPYHIDHPGTPLQLIFSVTIFLRWGLAKLFSSNPQAMIDSVISQPELYLHDVALLLLVLNLWALFFFGRCIFQASGKLFLGMFCQLSLLSFILMAPKSAYPAPEALLIFASLCLLGLTATLIFKPIGSRAHDQPSSTKWIGLVGGLGLAVKVTFAPMLLLIFLLPGKQLRFALCWATGAFLVLTAAAMPHASRFFTWLSNIVSHTGIHGSGQTAVLNVSSIPVNALKLWTWFPFFCAALIASLFFLSVLWFSKARSTTRGAWTLVTVGFLQSLLVLKHPGAHYMAPALPIAFVLMAWWYVNCGQHSRILKSAGVFITCLFVANSVALSVRGIQKLTIQREEMTLAMDDIARILKLHPEAIVICSFRCALPQYALSMAFIYAPGLITEATTTSLRNFYDFDIFQSRLVSIGRPSQSGEAIFDWLRQGRDVFLVTPRLYPELSAFKTKSIVTHSAQTIYQVLLP